MASWYRRIPAVLAAVALGAHFFRSGDVIRTALCLLLTAVFFVRRPPAVLVARALLVAGSWVWIYTAGRLAQARMSAGHPHARMVAILVGVAAFTVLSAWLLPGAGRDYGSERTKST